MGKFLDWLDHRTGYRKLRDAMLLEHIPGGARWRYVWGSTLAFVFVIQLVTGILLMTAYVPGDEDAWSSVYYIQYEMDFGWFIRGLHHYGSQTMVVLMGLHMLQVVIAGAHLPPREVNWWLGLALMGLILGLSLTGYLLPWDQKGYYATQVATNLIGNTPLIGSFLQKVLVGGTEYGHQTLTHFFALHVGILPPLVIVFIILHIVAFRRHGVTAPLPMPEAPAAPAIDAPVLAPERYGTSRLTWFVARDAALGGALAGLLFYLRVPIVTCILIFTLFLFFGVSRFFIKPTKNGYFWPEQAFRDLVVCLWIFAIMMSLVMFGGHTLGFGGHGHKIQPAAGEEAPGTYERWAKAGRDGLGVNLDAPADPVTESYDARPEWYFLFLFQLLKYFTGEQEIIGSVVIPGIVGFILFLVPLLGYGRMRKFGHNFGIVFVSFLLLAAGGLSILAMAADSPTSWPFGLGGSEKAREFVKRRAKADEEARLAIQAASQGIPSEGARYLVRGNPQIAGKRLFKQNCAVCHGYDFQEPAEEAGDGKPTPPQAPDLTNFASKEWIRGLLQNPGDKKYFGSTPHLNGMIGWRKKLDKARLKMKPDEIAEQDKELDEVSWFLAEQAHGPEHLGRLMEEEKYSTRWKNGLAIFEESLECGTCHKVGPSIGNPGGGPDLGGYGSAQWLHSMILHPAHPSRYGRKNKMPAFQPPDDSPGGKVLREVLQEVAPDQAKNDIVSFTDFERELVVRFLSNDPRVVFGGQPPSGPPKKKK